jgi:hypothetical protein
MASEKKDKSYPIEPEDDADVVEPPPQTPPAGSPGTEADAAEAPEPASIQALDVCPNCGSPLGGVDVVVCLRCGFDMKSLKVIETETGETAGPKPQPEQEESPVLSEPGIGDFWLPLAMAVGGLLVLAAGYLWGSAGLFGGEEAVGLGGRAIGLLKMLLKTAVLTLSGLGGLYALAHMVSSRVGDARLALIRMLGIMVAIGLLAFFNVNSAALEWTIESVTQALAFLGLSMVLFRLGVRDAATLLGVTLIAVVGLLLVSALVLWSVVPGN